jgi:acetyl esterase/lipase
MHVVRDGPSVAARMAWLSARLLIRPALSAGSHLPSAPWPWGAVEYAARAIVPAPGTVRGYEPEQIVLAGDCAGGYLALALAQRLLEFGEEPAALVAMSPLLQLARQPKTARPRIGSDAMFPPGAFDAFHGLITRAAAHREANGHSDALYEPLDHIQPGLPPR